ncbi:DUF3710 domain-containing protein [Lapillicoccus sp.]|uniref:DUF3710 domain-containing protein n=1 Tax=Lapillicoccus sp. TaxID=1909287 RepID=UPI003982F39F
MGIFRRGRKGDGTLDEAPVTTGAPPGTDVAADAEGSVDGVVGDVDAGGEHADGEPVDTTDGDDAVEEHFSRVRGPFDSSEAAQDEAGNRLDLGSIQLVPVDGMQLRLELDETQENVLGAHALIGESGVQLQAFAAPRTMGLWQDIRTEIAESIVSQGGTADEVRGPLGRELIARMPSRGADGRTVFQPVRFLGVDGPRWFLRAVISGKAALEEVAAEPLVELVRSVVVMRGDDARPPREILTLKLPADIQQDEPAAAGAEAVPGDDVGLGDDGPQGHSASDLKPFERGPEITEVR